MVSNKFDAFTVIPARGYWKGRAEDSLIIEIGIDVPVEVLSALEEKIDALCEEIKHVNKQQGVMVTSERLRAEFI
jgi:hypothetical protein